MSQTVRKARRTLRLKVNASAPDARATSDQAGATGNAEMPGGEAPPSQMSASSEIEPQLWTEADEATYQGLASRRKAAGYQRRARRDGSQLITAGDIRPNPNTTVRCCSGSGVSDRQPRSK
jgi:hypothetical protein